MEKSSKKLILETLMHIGVCVLLGPAIMVFWMITYHFVIDGSAK